MPSHSHRKPSGTQTGKPKRVRRQTPRLEVLEDRTLLSILLGEGGRRVARFHDADGDLVTMRLQGPGSAEVTLQGDVATNADLQSLVVRGTDWRSRLTLRVRGDVPR